MTKTKNETPPAPQCVSKIEIDFVNRTMTLWDWDDLVATYRPERTAFDIRIIAHDPVKDFPPVPQRDLSYYDKMFKKM